MCENLEMLDNCLILMSVNKLSEMSQTVGVCEHFVYKCIILMYVNKLFEMSQTVDVSVNILIEYVLLQLFHP